MLPPTSYDSHVQVSGKRTGLLPLCFPFYKAICIRNGYRRKHAVGRSRRRAHHYALKHRSCCHLSWGRSIDEAAATDNAFGRTRLSSGMDCLHAREGALASTRECLSRSDECLDRRAAEGAVQGALQWGRQQGARGSTRVASCGIVCSQKGAARSHGAYGSRKFSLSCFASV